MNMAMRIFAYIGIFTVCVIISLVAAWIVIWIDDFLGR
jgi:hypothetical protein